MHLVIGDHPVIMVTKCTEKPMDGGKLRDYLQQGMDGGPHTVQPIADAQNQKQLQD